MRRRTFLAIGCAGVAGAGSAGLVAVQPTRRALPAANPDGRLRPAGRRRVAVVGGGLAGLSTAIALGKRSFEVHLYEASNHLGGKLGGWEIEALGRSFPMEHGFHGFFRQYYNLNALLEEAGCAPDLVPAPAYPIIYADRAPEYFEPSTAPFPFNLASVLNRSKSIGYSDFLGIFPGLLKMMAYDRRRTFSALDAMSFGEFLRTSGIPSKMSEVILAPFGNATMNHIERLSAAEAIRFFHVYFFGNPEGLAFRFLGRDVMTAVIDRLEALAERYGVTIHKSTPVQRILREGDRVAGIEIPSTATEPASEPHRAGPVVPLEDLDERRWRLHSDEGEYPIFVRKARDGEGVDAIWGRCTHMGCPVQLADDGRGFFCPCHGGAFDAEGEPRRGPPSLPLVKLPTVGEAGAPRVVARPGAAEVVSADYFVIACDSTNARRLVEASELGGDGWAAKVRRLEPADPYAVLRLWLDRPAAADRPAFSTIHQYPLTDSLAIYSSFQEPYVTWARENQASVVESHAYAIEPERQLGADAIRDAMVSEVRQLLPELRDARVLHSEFMLQNNFTALAPGVDAHRPPPETDLTNLFAAGDWVRLPIPAFLMEAAVASGKLVANLVFEREGLKTNEIPHVDHAGPLA